MQATTVILEGADGSGKTQITEQVAARLRGYGLRVFTLADPGSTALGARVRGLLGVDDGASAIAATALAKFLLYQAARVETEQTLLAPALEAADVILFDRWVPSTYVFQVLMAKLDESLVLNIVESTCGYRTADVALYLAVAPDVLKRRLARRDGRVTMLKECEREVFAYEAMIADHGGWQTNWHPINAEATIQDVVTGVTELVWAMHDTRKALAY